MGLVEFLILVVVVVVLTFLATALIDYLAPSHPQIINKCLWVLAAVIILWTLAGAMGFLSHDIRIPHV